jgi:hypothetical protein
MGHPVYGSILPPTSLYQRKKSGLFHLGILRNVNIFYKIVDIFLIFKKKKSAKKMGNYVAQLFS